MKSFFFLKYIRTKKIVATQFLSRLHEVQNFLLPPSHPFCHRLQDTLTLLPSSSSHRALFTSPSSLISFLLCFITTPVRESVSLVRLSLSIRVRAPSLPPARPSSSAARLLLAAGLQFCSFQHQTVAPLVSFLFWVCVCCFVFG